ncbi:MAG: TolC family protein, partial [Candidatus Sulfotelmatobacter sp.]
DQVERAIAQRVKEGVDSEIDGSKARLSVARVRLRMVEASGSADVLREHLSRLIGLPSASIEIDPDSVPALPVVKPEADPDTESLAKATDANPVVQAAVEHARAQYLRVKGEQRSLWPSIDFAAQYALLATYNNYDAYYTHFQPNNATVGVAIHLPFLNLAQHERVKEAESEARKATKQAEAARNQVSEETLRLERSVTQLQDARDVAELEYEIAQSNVKATRTRMESSTATIHDLGDAETQASERWIKVQDVTIELERSQVELLRATGDLDRWALGAK